MNKIFTPPVLEELKQQIVHSLRDTFNIMFSLQLSLSEAANSQQSPKALKSYIELSNHTTKAFLDVSIPLVVIDQLVKAIDPENGMKDSNMGQDVACEIANIVGHAIRSYFINLSNINLNVELPQIGSAQQASPDSFVLSLHFLGEASDPVNLDFFYSESA